MVIYSGIKIRQRLKYDISSSLISYDTAPGLPFPKGLEFAGNLRSVIAVFLSDAV